MIYQGFLNVIIDFFVGLISKINGTIVIPLFNAIFSRVFGFDDFFSSAEQLLNDYVYNSIGFAKNVIINITGLPNGLFVAISLFLMFMFSLFMSSLIIRFFFNAYGIFRTGKSVYMNGGTHKK